MARPTARVLRLLELLQAGGTHPVSELAERLEVDERTVRRYVEHLVDLEVPVHSVRGRYGGYRLAAGFRMPPLMLTDEEALATLLGLAVLRESGLGTPGAAEEAEAKVRRVLPQRLAARLGALLESAEVSGRGRATSDVTAEVLLVFAEGARDRRRVAFAYRSGRDRDSARSVAPYGIVAHRGRWFVTGADSDSGEVRTFRLDRVRFPRLLAETFAVPEDFEPVDRVLSGIAAAPRRHLVRALVEGTVEDVGARMPASVATVAPAEPGWVRVEIHAESLDWVPGMLLGTGRVVVVEKPAELAATLRDLARRVLGAGGP